MGFELGWPVGESVMVCNRRFGEIEIAESNELVSDLSSDSMGILRVGCSKIIPANEKEALHETSRDSSKLNL